MISRRRLARGIAMVRIRQAGLHSRGGPTSNRMVPARLPPYRLHLAESLEEFALLVGDDGTAEDIAVAAEIFRGRMHDEIGAEIEWALDQGRPGIVAGQERWRRCAIFGGSGEVGQFQSRIDGVSTQTRRVGRADGFWTAVRSVISTKSTWSCQRPKRSRNNRKTP